MVNSFKFHDCRYCKNVGQGDQIFECDNCEAGENFEPDYLDVGDMMDITLYGNSDDQYEESYD